MSVLARNVDLKAIKEPVILVKEFGLNVFGIAASAHILLRCKKGRREMGD